MEGDVKMLSRINGVGKKTAERIVIELKDKLGEDATWSSSPERILNADEQKLSDAVSALIALGSKPKEAQESVRGAVTMLGPNVPIDELVRTALQKGK